MMNHTNWLVPYSPNDEKRMGMIAVLFWASAHCPRLWHRAMYSKRIRTSKKNLSRIVREFTRMTGKKPPSVNEFLRFLAEES